MDSIQQRLVDYTDRLNYSQLSAATIHAAIVRVIDTLGALIGGFDGEPCRIVRNVAARVPDPDGATVIGTAMKTTPDMAAFVNGTTTRYVEMNDVYHWPGSAGGHPSDVLAPILAAAEHAHASGRDFITAVVLGYEIYLRLSDTVHSDGFDPANFAALATAAAAGKLLGLPPAQLAHGIAMAAVTGNILKQVRTGHLSMWKAVAAGQAGRSGVLAALLARAGLDGPALPFEGTGGWTAHVAGKPFALDVLGGEDVPFKIGDTMLKPRASCASTISSILAAEKVAPSVRDRLADIAQVTVEVYERAKVSMGTGEHHWNPDSRETADHSIPYVVAATLLDGTVTPRQFDADHRRDPQLRALLPKIEVVSNAGFTGAYERLPVEHRTRVSVVLRGGERLVGESGGDQGDLSAPKTDAEVGDKFLALSADFLGADRARAVLASLWTVHQLDDLAQLPRDFVRS